MRQTVPVIAGEEGTAKTFSVRESDVLAKSITRHRDHLSYLGGLVWDMAWLPAGEEEADADLLAVAVHHHSTTRTNLMATSDPAPATVQFWRLARDEVPRLQYCLVHRGGVCRALAACPARGLPACVSKAGHASHLGACTR